MKPRLRVVFSAGLPDNSVSKLSQYLTALETFTECIDRFSTSEIPDWVDETLYKGAEVIRYEPTARCPRCGIDSVIGSASGYPITREFLQTMNSYWFGQPMTPM